MSEARIILAAGTLARTLDFDEYERSLALAADGFDEGEAWRLIALLPIAFSRPILEDLGVRRFVDEVTAHQADGTVITAKLTRQPEYVVGLRLARRHRRAGKLDLEVYKRVAGSSADIDAVSNALNRGMDVTGAAVASSLLGDEIARHLIR